MTAAPGRLPCWLVLLTVRALPRGSVRARAHHELLGDLYGLGGRRQLREAASMLLHCVALRAAVTTDDQEAAMSAVRPLHKPLRCYLRHKLRTVVTEEGTTYRTCVRCGEDHYDGVGDNGARAGAIIGTITGTPGR